MPITCAACEDEDGPFKPVGDDDLYLCEGCLAIAERGEL